MSMRAQSGRGSSKLAGIVEYAHFVRSAAVSIVANSMVGHPLESLPVPLTQNIMSTCIIILQTGGCVWAFCRIVPLATKILWGHCPPKLNIVGALAPPAPPVPPPMLKSVTYINLLIML